MNKLSRTEIRFYKHGLRVVHSDLNLIRLKEKEYLLRKARVVMGPDALQESNDDINTLAEALNLIYKAIDKLDSIP